MKLPIISGSFPPNKCGVGDYTANLALSLSERGIHTEVLTSGNQDLDESKKELVVKSIVRSWKVRDMYSIVEYIKKEKYSAINLQYPTVGYGFYLGPLFLTILFRLSGVVTVLTLHEYSNAHLLRKIHNIFLMLFSTRIILTTDKEEEYILRIPLISNLIRKKINIVNIASNIVVHKNNEKSRFERTNKSIVISYFGMFYPNKNVELLIELMSILESDTMNFELQLIGNVHEYYKDYFEQLVGLSKKLGIEKKIKFITNADNDEVVELLDNSFVCILPFEDGISLRRGSYLASAMLGIPVISTKGKSTDKCFIDGKNVIFGESVSDVKAIIMQLLNNEELYNDISYNTYQFGRNFTWEAISERYIEVLKGVNS